MFYSMFQQQSKIVTKQYDTDKFVFQTQNICLCFTNTQYTMNFLNECQSKIGALQINM